MLDTIREFGADHLPADVQTATRDRLIARCLTMAQGFIDHFADDDQLDRLRGLRREYASIRAALEYTLEHEHEHERVADGIALATALFAYWRARGLLAEGTYWLGKAVERSPAGSPAQAMALLMRGRLAAIRGNGDLALIDAAESLRLGTELGDDWIIAHCYLLRNLALTVSGRLAEAAVTGAEARRRLSRLDARVGLIDLEVQLTHLALLSRDTEAAIEQVRRGLSVLGNGRERWLHGKLYLLAAIAFFLDGRVTESTGGTIRALDVNRQIGDATGIALCVEVLGWLAAGSGRHERAALLLGGADHFWDLAGARVIATSPMWRLHHEAVTRATDMLGDKRFEALFARAAGQRSDEVVAYAASGAHESADHESAALRVPGQLTVREHEIATLVAQGLSNRQIAEKLFVSRRTVDAHVEHIFGKLGITSRVMLAIRLREHQATVTTG
jgi:non-specific serine/threonine protein kinase